MSSLWELFSLSLTGDYGALTIRLLGSQAINFLEECSRDENFKNVIKRVGTEKLNTKYDQELVLRFFAMKNDMDSYRYPVTEYLTRYLEKMTVDPGYFDFAKEKKIFQDTFQFINQQFGEEAFSGKTSNGTIRNEFVLYYFDGIAVPLAGLIEKIKEYPDGQKIKDCICQIKYGTELQSYKTGSVNGVKKRIDLFTEGVRKVLDGR